MSADKFRLYGDEDDYDPYFDRYASPDRGRKAPVSRPAPKGQSAASNHPRARRREEEIWSSSDRRMHGTVKKKKKKHKGFAAVLVCVLLLVVGSVFVYGWRMLDKVNYKDRNDFEIIGTESAGTAPSDVQGVNAGALKSDSAVRNILLLGSDDAEEGTYGRSDSMILVSIDSKSGKLKMTSFLRDTFLPIPGFSEQDRLNAAFSHGGPGLCIKTIEENFRVRVDNYVQVDFSSFKQIIDILGGVDIELTEAEARYLNQIYNVSLFAEGPYHMDGDIALSYARIRKIDSDFGRTQRQRKVLETIMAKLRAANPGQLLNVVNQTADYVTTDLGKGDMLALAAQATSILGYQTEELHVPVNGAYTNETIRKMDVLVPDMQANRKAVWDFIYGESGEDE
jgi:LCP family protein required for cell wall assembly